MSYLKAFFITCAVITVVTPVCLWQIHRAWKAEQAKNETPAPDPQACPDGPLPAAPDNVPGVNLALQDECQLIYSLPAHGTTDHTTTPEGDS